MKTSNDKNYSHFIEADSSIIYKERSLLIFKIVVIFLLFLFVILTIDINGIYFPSQWGKPEIISAIFSSIIFYVIIGNLISSLKQIFFKEKPKSKNQTPIKFPTHLLKKSEKPLFLIQNVWIRTKLFSWYKTHIAITDKRIIHAGKIGPFPTFTIHSSMYLDSLKIRINENGFIETNGIVKKIYTEHGKEIIGLIRSKIQVS